MTETKIIPLFNVEVVLHMDFGVLNKEPASKLPCWIKGPKNARSIGWLKRTKPSNDYLKAFLKRCE